MGHPGGEAPRGIGRLVGDGMIMLIIIIIIKIRMVYPNVWLVYPNHRLVCMDRHNYRI